MAANKKLLMLPGDGIGPEVMGEVRRVIDWMDKRRSVSFDLSEDIIGGCCIDAHNTPLKDETIADAQSADAVLLGAVGGPKWDNVAFDIRPEAGLLRIRKDLGLFANLRPAIVFDALADASSLKREIVSGLDILIIRELTGGIYFGEPRGVEDLPGGGKKGYNTLVYSTPEVERITRVAFELAQKRGKKLCSIDKANVLESTKMWREEVERIAPDYADVELSHMLVDNAAMQLVRDPKQFDVIVTTNMFGDILSDCASMATGSLGMLPSASLGAPDESGRRNALYEPVHGTAPDIAGQGKANPLAMMLSFAMMLRYSFDMEEDASLVEASVEAVLDAGLRTGDIMSDGKNMVSTTQMGEAVIAELDKRAA
ncbi:MAG: 3-isopropylmalate dehydrogenase [Rhodospirillaceae bacterium]|jgi:3-isopropylmalate dehydrogenase|nr:3-isopropylmalate dehydrogenase [Rhodospirillaceae bacterium]